jgi:hypothetical protein
MNAPDSEMRNNSGSESGRQSAIMIRRQGFELATIEHREGAYFLTDVVPHAVIKHDGLPDERSTCIVVDF